MQRNIKLFPFYKGFSYDILFYAAISILYLTSVKGLSVAQIALTSSIYGIASIVFQLPASIIVDKLGLRHTMIIGNIMCLCWGIVYIIATSFSIIIIGDLFLAFGFAMKGVSESPFIYSILKTSNKIEYFTKLEGKGSTLYFILETAACIVTGSLYAINPYLPITFSCICCLIATIISYNFTSQPPSYEVASSNTYINDLIDGFKFIFRSKRLHALLVFSSLFYGIIVLSTLYMRAFLNNFGVSPTSFGYIFAILAISSALGSIMQERISGHHRNRTLSILSVTFILSFIAIGIFSLTNFSVKAIVIISVLVFMIQATIRSAYRIIIKQYISRYTTTSIRTKLMSIYYLSEHFGAGVMLYFASTYIDKFQLGFIYIISGFVLFICILAVLNYMNSRVGLKPEEYTKKDRMDLE